MIDLTPLEVRKKKGDFKRAMRGYDPALVDDFLDLVADRLEELVRENLSLSERTGRQDQQVTEYRDRERALTEALVTAQEMREEMRKQTTREVELARRAAEQEAAQVRAEAQQEVARLRSEAQHEVAQQRAAAQRESTEMHLAALHAREREEEAVRRLRARQQQFLSSYRAFLEREMTELGVITQTLGLTGGAPAAEEMPLTAAAPMSAPLAAAPLPMDFEPFEPEPFEDEVPDDPEAGADPISLRSSILPESGGAAEAVSLNTLLTFEEDLSGFESFEEDDDPDADDVALVEGSGGRETDMDAVAVAAADELELYDGVADDVNIAGIPGPIGFGDAGPYADATDPADAGLADDADEDDEQTSLLLRNAAAAGYSLPEDEELLLEDALLEDALDDDDGDDAPARDDAPADAWLPDLLEEDEA